ncbi:MAG TPA: hypothetical protein VG099_16995 [Gemmataceae bacterium]|jgi:hypothetical protein|nr:hypothetical protein [Gemmataceae bacterium]
MPGMKRKWFWLLALAIFVIIGAGYVLVPVSESRISQANCDKIQLGWTLEEVRRLLGEDALYGIDRLGGFTWGVWFDEDGNVIKVTFSDQAVTRKVFGTPGLSIYERIKRRIERRLQAVWRADLLSIPACNAGIALARLWSAPQFAGVSAPGRKCVPMCQGQFPNRKPF